MILPLIGLVIACVVFGTIGVVVLSRREEISEANLIIFVIAALASASLVGFLYGHLVSPYLPESPQTTLNLIVAFVGLPVSGSYGGIIAVERLLPRLRQQVARRFSTRNNGR